MYYRNSFDNDMEAKAGPNGYSTLYVTIWLKDETAILYDFYS